MRVIKEHKFISVCVAAAVIAAVLILWCVLRTTDEDIQQQYGMTLEDMLRSTLTDNTYTSDNGKVHNRYEYYNYSFDEYIGERTYNLKQLEKAIKNCTKNKKIDLNALRTEKFKENYKSINEFSDGKNIERIYEKLKELKYI